MTHIFEDIIGTFFHIVIFIIFLSNFNQIRCNFKHLFLFAFIVRLYKPPRAYKNIIVMENDERTYKKLARYFIRGWGKTAKPWYYYNVILKSIKKTSIFYHFSVFFYKKTKRVKVQHTLTYFDIVLHFRTFSHT